MVEALNQTTNLGLMKFWEMEKWKFIVLPQCILNFFKLFLFHDHYMKDILIVQEKTLAAGEGFKHVEWIRETKVMQV